MCFFLQLLSEYLILRTDRDMIKMFIGLHVKYPLLISGFHRAFLKSITFYWPSNALNCIKLKG